MRADGRPIAGRDYPRTWQEFEAWFPDEGACRQYLERLRWPDGFICPRCASRQGWRSKRGLWVCGGCQRQTSVTAVTVFADTHSLLRTWFATAWYVTGQKQGVSALGLQAVLGLGSYETAWSWLHNLSIPTMTDFATTALERGSTIRTDGLSSYRGLVAAGYSHQVITLKAVEEPAHVAMPAVHRVASLLQRWLLGTHQGAVRVHHLDYYLDEFTFRFNRRGARHRGLLFFRLLQQAVATRQVTVDQLTGRHHNMLGSLE